MFALAAVSAMMFALPAIASAEAWDTDWATDSTKALTFTTSAGESKLTTANSTVTCTGAGGGNTGSGSYPSNSTTTGTVTLTFRGCSSSGANCHSGASADGIIATEELPFHNVWANKDGAKTAGILITSNATSGRLARFKCTIFGVGPEIIVTGSVIGEVEKCGEVTESTLNFQSASAGNQTITTLWNTPGTFDLTADNNGTPETASQDGTGTIKFGEKANLTC